MKKFKILLLSCGLVMLLAACGSGGGETLNNTDTSSAEDTREIISEVSPEDTSEAAEITNNSDSGLSTVVFPESFESLAGVDEEELRDYLEANGSGNYEEISIVNGQVGISVDETQRTYWLDFLREEADKQEEILTAASSKYHASCNDEYTDISIFFDTLMSSEVLGEYTWATATYCAMYQLFDGAQDYTVYANYYNVDTGKLIIGGNLEEGALKCDTDDYEASYTLTEDEAKELTLAADDNCEETTIQSSFVNGISIIAILQQAGGTDYQYIYLNENDDVVLGTEQSQRTALIDILNQYLEDVAAQFSDLGDGYEISWSSDYSSLEFKFDDELSKQDQANYFAYTETVCMINQLLSGSDGTYYIDINIYNSATGELVSNGNTVDGITWNI